MIIDICPTVDLAFKLMLGSPEHTAVTVHFLNAVLVQRLTYYAGRLYVGQMREGMPYRDLRPAISICVLSKSMFPQLSPLHLDFRLRERSGQVFGDELQIHLVELPKSRASLHNMGEVSPLERWAFLLLYAHRIDADELRRLLPDPEFHDALGVLEMITRTPATRELYEARLKAKLDEEARLDYARTEGRAEGEQIGQQRGEQIGQIRLLEQFLVMTPTASEELAQWSLEQLAIHLADLQRIFRERNE